MNNLDPYRNSKLRVVEHLKTLIDSMSYRFQQPPAYKPKFTHFLNLAVSDGRLTSIVDCELRYKSWCRTPQEEAIELAAIEAYKLEHPQEALLLIVA